MIEQLKKHINAIHPIPNEILDEFLVCWEFTKHNKKDTISNIDTTDKYFYFSTKGVQKAFFVKEGKEFIIAFTKAFSFTCVPESFLTQVPSKYSFQCVTDSEFYRISYHDFLSFVEKHHDLEIFLRKALLNLVNVITSRYHRLMTCSIEERFKDFMNNNSQLLNLIPQKDIANFLNMNPTNFSKLINSIKI